MDKFPHHPDRGAFFGWLRSNWLYWVHPMPQIAPRHPKNGLAPDSALICPHCLANLWFRKQVHAPGLVDADAVLLGTLLEPDIEGGEKD